MFSKLFSSIATRLGYATATQEAEDGTEEVKED
jgi:hypothetical protein